MRVPVKLDFFCSNSTFPVIGFLYLSTRFFTEAADLNDLWIASVADGYARNIVTGERRLLAEHPRLKPKAIGEAPVEGGVAQGGNVAWKLDDDELAQYVAAFKKKYDALVARLPKNLSTEKLEKKLRCSTSRSTPPRRS